MLSLASTATHCGSSRLSLDLSWRSRNLYLCCVGVEDVNAVQSRIGHDYASVGVDGHAVGPHHWLRSASPATTSTSFLPEALLTADVAFRSEDALEGQLAPAFQQKSGGAGTNWALSLAKDAAGNSRITTRPQAAMRLDKGRARARRRWTIVR